MSSLSAFTQTTEEAAKRAFRTAVVPAAGLGTRFLPTTKAVPKELFPVVDTPGIELVATEAAQAGADRLVIVTSPGKDAVANYFRHQPELERTLKERGKTDLLAKVQRGPDLIHVETALQTEALGLGHAVGCVEDLLTDEDEAIAVLLPDDLVLPYGILNRMAEVRAQFGGSVLCAVDIPLDKISAYGVFDVDDVHEAGAADDVKRVKGMVEKPAPEDAPSTFAAAGRYLLDRAIFDALKRIKPGAGGELQLTDAVELLIEEGHPVHIVVHRGKRHDLGNPGGFLRAAVDFGLQHPEYGTGLREYLLARLGEDSGNGSA
jgi:UTP--glucose-1-phosphate uridylyltransferase